MRYYTLDTYKASITVKAGSRANYPKWYECIPGVGHHRHAIARMVPSYEEIPLSGFGTHPIWTPQLVGTPGWSREGSPGNRSDFLHFRSYGSISWVGKGG